MDIATGQPEDHPSLLPLAPDPAPPVQGATVPVASGPADSAPLVTGVRDLTGERLDQLAGYEADIRSAQQSGMDARNTMLDHYHGQALPGGGMIGDEMTLPEVPANTVPPAQSDLYPYSGMEPTPASAGMDGYPA